MMLGLYRLVGGLAAPLVWGLLAWRLAQGKEDRARFRERFGEASRPRPDGPLVWLHAASVGESLSLLPLVDRLAARSKARFLVTTGTVSAARILAPKLPDRAFHQYVPVDRRPYVRNFLDHWRPDLVLWAESEFWPNLICETAARGVPMILVNGRVSERSFASWRRATSLIRRLLAGFTVALAQSEEDRQRLRDLGARDSRFVGNLKFAAEPLPADADALKHLQGMIGTRRVWLAASTHAGEEDIAGEVHRRVSKRFPDLLTIIVPRHPDRGPRIAASLADRGLRVARRADGEAITAETGVYVADTLGELGLFYRLAPVAFVGKSLVPLGGQNPVEPAKLGAAIVHGPHMGNFAAIAGRMKTAGAAVEVADAAALAVAVERLLDDEAERGRLAAAAKHFADAESHVLDDVVRAVGPYLDRLAERTIARP
ncbi:MAG: 3-deoxy-D-manno-octulosonic acid transferase [Rhodospirillales bacterium]|nr:3-deoxy-D-manno-octulosonic acid transferase [Rhodospirillales bacterium]